MFIHECNTAIQVRMAKAKAILEGQGVTILKRNEPGNVRWVASVVASDRPNYTVDLCYEHDVCVYTKCTCADFANTIKRAVEEPEYRPVLPIIHGVETAVCKHVLAATKYVKQHHLEHLFTHTPVGSTSSFVAPNIVDQF